MIDSPSGRPGGPPRAVVRFRESHNRATGNRHFLDSALRSKSDGLAVGRPGEPRAAKNRWPRDRARITLAQVLHPQRAVIVETGQISDMPAVRRDERPAGNSVGRQREAPHGPVTDRRGAQQREEGENQGEKHTERTRAQRKRQLSVLSTLDLFR